MIDPRTTNIVGQRVLIVRRTTDPDKRKTLARGVVRVVDYQDATFVMLIEAVGTSEDMDSWFSVVDGSLFQVSVADETIEVMVDRGVPEIR